MRQGTRVDGARRAKEKMDEKMRLARYLPNVLTALNLACGTGALLIALDGRVELVPMALGLIVLALAFDLADGRVARHLGVTSPLGLELDSLADLVSFGAAPAVLLWRHRLSEAPTAGLIATLAFVMAGAFRLARFNVLSQSGRPATRSFVGLPIPAAAALALTAGLGHSLPGFGSPVSTGLTVLATLAAALLMVSTVPFPSMKMLPLGRPGFAGALLAGLTGSVLMLQGRVALLSVAYVALGVALAAAGALPRYSPRSAIRSMTLAMTSWRTAQSTWLARRTVARSMGAPAKVPEAQETSGSVLANDRPSSP
jgi:CDP-diacylglycerol--serine O-phosphatidyltransferase